MDTYILLSFIALTSVLIYLTFYDPNGSAAKKLKSSFNMFNKAALGMNTNNAGKSPRIFLPDVFANSPRPRRVHPNYDAIKRDVSAWISGFKAFSPKAQKAFDRCDSILLACMACSDLSAEHARAGSDLMQLFLMFDEYSDRSKPSWVREQKNIILDAFRNPHMPRPKGEWVGGEIARQFWERTIENATEISQRRFIRSMDDHLESIVQESINRQECRILDVKSYIEVRRRTVGLRPASSIYELGFDIPDEVMSHPAVREMILAAVDMVAFLNDLYSYNLEQMRGDEFHNIITCVMHEYHTDVNGAILWVEASVYQAMNRFHTAKAALPTWQEPLNTQIRTYCDGLDQFVRANHDWSFESGRYFGTKGSQIKENGWMSLLPKDPKSGTEIGPVRVDSSLL